MRSRFPQLMVIVLGTASLAHADAVPFDKALGEIVERNTAVASETANLNAAKARALPARLVFAPDLSIVAKTGKQGGSGYSWNGQDLELDSDLNLFRFGADVANLAAVSEDISSEEELVATVRLAAEDQGVQVLVARVQRELELSVDERIVGYQEELYQIARERYERGLLPLQEADQVSVDLDNAKARLADARVLEIQARAALDTALGRAQLPPANAGASTNESAGDDVAPVWPWFAALNDDALVGALVATRFDPSLRPDWRADRQSLDAESDRLTRADAMILPSLDANFSYATLTGFLSPTGLEWGPAYTGTVSLTIPLFDRLVNYSNSRVQAAVRDVAEQKLEQARRDTLGEWEAASRSFRVAVDSARARERTLTTARQLYKDNLSRFRAGKATANDLSIDESRLSDSETFAVDGWAAAHLAYSRVCHALGRSVESCQNPPGRSRN